MHGGQERIIETAAMDVERREGELTRRRFGQKRNTITKQFYRGMRKAAEWRASTWE